jgi:hypothetical protein
MSDTDTTAEATQAQPAVEAAPAPMLPLDAPRNIAIQFSGHIYRWYFRRIAQKDWERFFDRFRIESYRSGAEVMETFEFATAMRELISTTLERVEGYKLDAAKNPKWRDYLPEQHVRLFCMALREVSRSVDVGDGPLAITEHHEISLDALWASDEAGKAIRYAGLIHRFNAPTLEQQKKFNRAVNSTRVIGDSRNGRTLYPEKQKLEMAYYDELIAEVDGYSVGGAALTGVENIRREMDGCHKVAAINALLHAGGVVEDIPPAKPEGEGAGD